MKSYFFVLCSSSFALWSNLLSSLREQCRPIKIHVGSDSHPWIKCNIQWCLNDTYSCIEIMIVIIIDVIMISILINIISNVIINFIESFAISIEINTCILLDLSTCITLSIAISCILNYFSYSEFAINATHTVKS